MKFYRLSIATFYDRTNTIYQFIKSFVDKKYLFSYLLKNMKPLITDETENKYVYLQFTVRPTSLYSDLMNSCAWFFAVHLYFPAWYL